MSLRKVIFWPHLALGLLAGAFVAVMAFTGLCLAFEKELAAWAERDLRRVPVPAQQVDRLTVDELRGRVQALYPDLRAASATVSPDPEAAVVFAAGRGAPAFADPYTGDIRRPAPGRLRRFLDTMNALHRWLALPEAQRPAGRLLNGAANLAFLALCISGLYLWLPRRFDRRSLRAVAVLNLGLKRRARDWNWHHALGIWTLPLLVVVSATAVPISFRWGNDLVYRLAGEAAPQQASVHPGSGGRPGRSPEAPLPSYDALLAQAADVVPAWSEMTVGAVRRGPGEGGLAVTVRTPGAWPRTAAVTLGVDAATGEIDRVTAWEDQGPGRRARGWARFLHTGEALGLPGQVLAAIACLGALVLVYTGAALSWRRFLGREAAGLP
ncbi:MAG TPA: PepSY-associated TM helix domain-containing protein [Holophaga sp.]|nr:PepSY-associated TM helix domain-containing protein [Holophaga sp.]